VPDIEEFPVLVSLLPDEPEAKGLLALVQYSQARRPARRNNAGAYVPLEEDEWHLQRAPLWRSMIGFSN
jgi:RNA polymerase sigma-70 factor (ECF subfamily)